MLGYMDPKWIERVLDRGDHACCGWDRAAFSGAFDPNWIEGRGRFEMNNLDVWHVGCRWQEIVRVVRRYGLTGVVVDHAFKQRIADAVNHAAANLAVNNHWIDQPTAIMPDHVTQDRHPACIGIDLNLNKVSAVGESGLPRFVIGSR